MIGNKVIRDQGTGIGEQGLENEQRGIVQSGNGEWVDRNQMASEQAPGNQEISDQGTGNRDEGIE